MFDYAAYLESEAWKVKRELVVIFWGGRCALCSSPDRLEVHHRTYERVGNEKLTDLIPLCATCHERHHGVLGRDNATRPIADILKNSFEYRHA